MDSKTLSKLYAEHKGKVSDKWPLYLIEYDRIFSTYRSNPIKMLEVGIQNGGSLEIWPKYFRNGEKFIGCDIDPTCSHLEYDDPRVSLVIGDANSNSIHDEIIQLSSEFDIVIDDGSHISSDIIKSFANYFPMINDGGIYIAEDLHCSYWQEFEGGLFDPYSSISFFKLLADTLNHEHWGVTQKYTNLYDGFCEKYGFKLDNEVFEQVHSVEFINSMCVVRKSNKLNSRLGNRIIAGNSENVASGHNKIRGNLSETPSQNLNPMSAQESSPYQKAQQLEEKNTQIDSLTQSLAKSSQENNDLTVLLSEHKKRLDVLTLSVTQNIEKLSRSNDALAERNKQLEELRSSISWRTTRPLRVVAHQLRKILHTVNAP